MNMNYIIYTHWLDARTQVAYQSGLEILVWMKMDGIFDYYSQILLNE